MTEASPYKLVYDKYGKATYSWTYSWTVPAGNYTYGQLYSSELGEYNYTDMTDGITWHTANSTLTPTGTLLTGLISMSDGIWVTAPPKNDTITTVKVTADNLEAIAKYLVKQDGAVVQVVNDYIVYGDTVFHTNEWIVKAYDFKKNVTFYYVASLTEREKYNLR